MADQRQFVLIGDFTDNITPALDGINQAIGRLKATMAGMATKRNGGFADVTQSVGRLVSSQKHLAESIKEVGEAAKTATADLKEYKSMVGKVASAHFSIARASGQSGKNLARSWETAGQGLEGYESTLKRVARTGKRIKAPRLPKSAQYGGGDSQPSQMRSLGVSSGGGGGRGPRPPRGGGGGRGEGYNFHMGAFSFGMTLGQGISQPVTAAIFSGFQMGVGLMAKTLQYVQSSFMERVEDQMTDLQAAGGYYSISKRQKDPMFSSLQSAIMFTQRTNDVLERLASDLPGSTEDYVKVSKRIGDSVMRVVDSNEKGAIAFAKALVEKGGLQESYRGVSLEGPRAREGATQVIMGELTKKTVLSGFGGSVGRGGAAGAYGLPALMERLITNPDTSMAQLQKYASVFGDPKIMSALERAMPKLKAAGADMLKRTMLVNEMLDEIAPPEMIAAMRKSMAGVMEAYRSAFFSPGTGLFGFGRKLKDASGKLQPLTNVYGQFIKIVEENGKQIERVVKTAQEADQVDMAVFDMFADIVSNYAAILKPIVDNLSLLWDPMQGIANALRKARIVSTEILQSFRYYVGGLEDLGATIADKNLKEKFLSTKSFRASLLTISNLFTELGIFSETDFTKFQKDITSIHATPESLGKVLKSFIDTFFSSKAAYNVGKFFGEIVKSFGEALSDMTGFFAGLKSTQLVKGFMAGLGEDGINVITKIFKDIYTLLIEAAKAILPLIPWQVYALAAAGVIIPAAIAGLGMALAQGITTMITSMGGSALRQMAGLKDTGSFAVLRQQYLLDKAKATSGFGGGSSKPTTRTGAPKSAAFRAIPDTRIVNPQFPQVALGMRKGVGGVTGPYRAPSVPKPKEGLQGFKWLQKWLGNAITGNGDYTGAPKTKDLGKNLKIAGKGLKVQIASVAKNAFENVKGFTGKLGTKLGAGGLKGLKNPIGMLDKFGTALVGVTGVLNGVMRFFETGDVFKSLGAVAGPIIGNILGFAIAGPLGAFIGGWIMSQTQVTDKIGEVFRQVADSMAYVGKSLADTGNDLIKFVQSLTGAETEAQAFQQLLAGINIILFPLTATFDALSVAVGLVRIAALEVIMFVDKYLQGGKRQKELAADYLEANRSLNRLIAANDEKYAKISRKKGEKSVLGGKEVTWSGSEWVNPGIDRKVGQTATLNGKQVSWDGTKWTPAQKGAPAATPATPPPVLPKGVVPPAAAAAAAAPKEIAQTAANTQELNQKAATQITQAESIRTATQQTQKNTTVANTTLGNIRSGIMAVSNRIGMLQAAMLKDLNNIEAGVASISSLLSSGQLKVQGAGPGNGPMGTATGNLGRAQNLASQYGLSLTSYIRAGDKGYHGLGRAMDFSNGVSTPQQMEFAQAMVAQYGTSLKELIYTPLGFGIKDGVKVPLSYWGPGTNLGHYDHVHVAFANGPQDGRMFTQMGGPYGAQSWERSMVPGSVKVASITGNSREGFGETTINNTFHVSQLQGESGEALANRVATLFYDAMQTQNSIFG